MRTFGIFLIILLLSGLFHGCAKTELPASETDTPTETASAPDPLETVRTHLAEYTLVRADEISPAEQNCFMALRDAIAEATGIKPAAASDFTAAYPVKEKEIVLGKTGRDSLLTDIIPVAEGEGWHIVASGERLFLQWEEESARRRGAAVLLTLLCPDIDEAKGEEIIMRTLLARDAIPSLTAVTGGYVLTPLEDTYIRNGTHEFANFGSEPSLELKALTSPGYNRKILLRFSLGGILLSELESATLRLYATALETTSDPGGRIVARLAEGNWKESTATYGNADEKGTVAAEAYVTQNAWCALDLTETVKAALEAGQTELSLILTGDYKQPLLMRFCSREAAYNTPELRVVTDSAALASMELKPAPGIGTADDVRLYAKELVDEYLLWKKEQADPAAGSAARIWGSSEEYPRTSQAGKSGGVISTYNSRTPDTVTGFDSAAAQPERSEYGGRTDVQLEATGFFRVQEIDGRFWFIDPAGHPYMASALGYVCPGTSTAQKTNIHNLYGSESAWGEDAADTLKNDFAFTAVTHLSRPDLLNAGENKLPYAHTFSFLSGYARQVGAAAAGAGHHDFADNGTMPVFDPAFADYCDTYAKSLAAQYKEDPYFLGYMSDNELPISLLMLDNSLSLLPENGRSVFTYAVAHAWLTAVTGKENPTAADITDELRSLYCEFVYDRYFRVVTEAIRRYDENHLYLGCRFMYPGYLRDCFIRAAGRWCDVLTMNYYFVWEPETELITRWRELTGKPFMITEFYLKGADSGLPNTAGAGWTGKTQTDRADFYSTYVLRLIESGSCVGWSWLQYWDNDPTSGTSDATSTNANKGIYTTAFQPYTVLTDRMSQVNRLMYTLADHFDARQ